MMSIEEIERLNKHVIILWRWARIYIMISCFGLAGAIDCVIHEQYAMMMVIDIALVFFPGFFVYRIGIHMSKVNAVLKEEMNKAKAKIKDNEAEIESIKIEIAIREARIKEIENMRNRVNEN
jgi:hypothetical protein